MGKTAAMMRIVEAVALQESRPNVLIFSIEMPEAALTERITSSVGRIELGKMRTGKLEDNDWAKLTAATMLLSGAKIHYCDTSSISLAGMRTVIRRIEREHGKLSLVAVDYLQLIDERGENQTHAIGKISTGLKKIAKDFDVPMLALSQLNRGLENRSDKRPIASDLRQSGAIEQDADLIIMLYRDEVYNEDSADKGVMELIIVKHRNGAIGTVRALYIGQYTRVDNMQSQGGY
jgi:replicative DNA helicase